MDELHRYEFADSPRAEVVKKVDIFFEPYAQDIVDLLNTNDFCITSGFWGNGKSSFLLPAIKRNLEGKGIEVRSYASWKYRVASKVQEILPKTDRAVLIMDELGDTNGTNDNPSEFLEAVYDAGYSAIVGVIAFRPDTTVEKMEPIENRWIQARGPLGKGTAIYRLPHIRYSDDLARDYVTVFSHKIGPEVTDEVINYVIETIPHVPRFLYFVSTNLIEKTIPEVIKYVDDMRNLLDFHLTPVEINELLYKIKKDKIKYGLK